MVTATMIIIFILTVTHAKRNKKRILTYTNQLFSSMMMNYAYVDTNYKTSNRKFDKGLQLKSFERHTKKPSLQERK